ncbi:MAG: glycosyltransferase, partial [Patescibacteria group bacterium]
ETVFYIRDVLLAFFLTFLSARFRKQFVFEIHSLGKFPNFVYGRIFRLTEKIISTNSAKKEAICVRWGLSPQKILVAPNGVDLRLFENLPLKEEARKEFGLPLDKEIVMYTGSEQKWKGTSIIQELTKNLHGVLFVVVGGRLAARPPSHLAVRPLSESNVRILPWMPYAKLPRVLAAADVLLVTVREGDVRSERWTSPIKLPTYMASGVPIAAPATSAVRELLDDNSAFLAKENNPASLAEQIRRALQDTEEAGTRALRAREKAQKLDWRRRARNILAFIQTS